MLPCMFLWPVTFFLFVNAEGFSQVMAARAAMTVLDSVGVPAWQAFFVDLSPREHRGRINAIASVSWAIIGSAGSVAGGTLYEGFSARAPFLVTAALQFVGAVIALLTFREPSRREE